MKQWKKEKRDLLKQTRNYLKALADTGASVQLIAAVQAVRDRAATADAEDWQNGKYWPWWTKIRPGCYAER